MTNANYVDERCRSLEYDHLFEILANRQRRILLHSLVENPISSVDELVDTAAEHVSIDRSQLQIAAVHMHLPKIDETTLIDYDPRSKTVRYYESDTLEAVLDRTASADLAAE